MELLPDAEVMGLLALMLLQESRRTTRTVMNHPWKAPFTSSNFGTGSPAWELEKFTERGIQKLGDRVEY